MRLIDADALLDYLTVIPIDLGYREVEDIEEYVKNMPTIEERKTGGWIKTKDRLPEPGRKVLCCGVRGGMYIGEILTGLGKPEWYSLTKHNPNPIAWMHLPKPYRKEN